MRAHRGSREVQTSKSWGTAGNPENLGGRSTQNAHPPLAFWSQSGDSTCHTPGPPLRLNLDVHPPLVVRSQSSDFTWPQLRLKSHALTHPHMLASRGFPDLHALRPRQTHTFTPSDEHESKFRAALRWGPFTFGAATSEQVALSSTGHGERKPPYQTQEIGSMCRVDRIRSKSGTRIPSHLANKCSSGAQITVEYRK